MFETKQPQKIKNMNLFNTLSGFLNTEEWCKNLNETLKVINDNPEKFHFASFNIGSFNNVLGDRIFVSIGVDCDPSGETSIKILFKYPEYLEKVYSDVLKTTKLFTYNETTKLFETEDSKDPQVVIKEAVAVYKKFNDDYIGQIVANINERQQTITDNLREGKYEHLIIEGQIVTIAEEVIPTGKFGEKGLVGDVRIVAKYRCQGNKKFLNFFYNFYHSKMDKVFNSNSHLECLRRMCKIIWDYDPDFKKFGPRD